MYPSWEASCRRTPGDVSAYDEFWRVRPATRAGHELVQEYEHTSALRVLNLDKTPLQYAIGGADDAVRTVLDAAAWSLRVVDAS